MRFRRPLSKLAAIALPMVLLIACGGCSSIFSSSFLNLITAEPPSGTGLDLGEITIDNASGHVALLLNNKTTFDSALLAYLEATGVEIDPDDPDLRPRIRVQLEITYTNGSTNTIEMITGSSLIEGGDYGYTVPPQLTEYDLTNVVAVCDISTIEPISVQIFVPVAFFIVEIIESEDVITREITGSYQPQFYSLSSDVVNDDGTVTLVRNFDVRDTPLPVTNPQCGVVASFTISGTLRMPFTTVDGFVFPGYLDIDEDAEAAAPGRFAFETTLR